LAKRSRRIAIVSHCLLNQNSKPYLDALYPGIVNPVFHVLEREHFGIVQMPCPEVAYGGLKRWWQVVEQYDTPIYRGYCKELASNVVDQVEQYLANKDAAIIIGIDGSPSCGVHYAGSNSQWQGRPNVVDTKYPVAEGKGILMLELEKEFNARGLNIPKMLGIGLDIPGFDLKSIEGMLNEELKTVTGNMGLMGSKKSSP